MKRPAIKRSSGKCVRTRWGFWLQYDDAGRSVDALRLRDLENPLRRACGRAQSFCRLLWGVIDFNTPDLKTGNVKDQQRHDNDAQARDRGRDRIRLGNQ